jgi:hypothetical protein
MVARSLKSILIMMCLPILMNLTESSQTDFAKLYWYWKVYEELFGFSQIGFIDYAKSLIAEMELWLRKWKNLI